MFPYSKDTEIRVCNTYDGFIHEVTENSLNLGRRVWDKEISYLQKKQLYKWMLVKQTCSTDVGSYRVVRRVNIAGGRSFQYCQYMEYRHGYSYGRWVRLKWSFL